MVATPRSIDAGIGIGEIFLDKYRVDAILGHGGMGVVAQCTHLALNEQVAIKMLRRDVLDDPEAVKRFMREAQAAARLKSEFVARVTDVGESDTKVPYMVMEYLEGHDLGDLLDQRGSLGVPWAVELTLQACEALAEAHSIGIVHRDVKPTNLFVTWRPDGSALIKVLDFGISKLMIVEGMQLTQTQSLLGTPAYMSPEQMRSARLVDSRTDLWSLGTVLYEMLEGHRPFEAESFSEMCVKVAVDPPQPMFLAPPALQQVVLRCLEKAPESRYASMAELAADLVPFSHDPHQAQVLVERMARTLRRSQVHEWDPARASMRMAARDLRSAERKAEVPAGPASGPVAAGSAAASDPALPVAPTVASAIPNPAARVHASTPSTPDVASRATPGPAVRVPPDPGSSLTPAPATRATPNPGASATPNLTPLPVAGATPTPASAPAAGTPSGPAASTQAAPAGASLAPAPAPTSAAHEIPSRRPRRRTILIAAAAVAGAAVLGGVISLARDPAPTRPADPVGSAGSAAVAPLVNAGNIDVRGDQAGPPSAVRPPAPPSTGSSPGAPPDGSSASFGAGGNAAAPGLPTATAAARAPAGDDPQGTPRHAVPAGPSAAEPRSPAVPIVRPVAGAAPIDASHPGSPPGKAVRPVTVTVPAPHGNQVIAPRAGSGDGDEACAPFDAPRAQRSCGASRNR